MRTRPVWLLALTLAGLARDTRADEPAPLVLPKEPVEAIKVLAAHPKPVVLYVTTSAAECAACKEVDAIVKSYAHDYNPTILTLDTATPETRRTLGAFLDVDKVPLPSFHLLRGGRILGRLSGVHDRQLIARWMEAWRRSTLGSRWTKQTPLACAQSIMDSLVMKGAFTASDLRQAWQAHILGVVDAELDPKLRAKLEPAEVRARLAPAFLAFDLFDYPDEFRKHPPILLAGDILAFSLPWMDKGAVAVVNDYDPDTLVADVTVYEEKDGKKSEWHDYDLSVYPKNALQRRVRAGFHWLRPLESPLCSATKW